MIVKAIHTLIVAVLLVILYLIAGLFIGGNILTAVGVLLLLIFLLWAVREWGLAS